MIKVDQYQLIRELYAVEGLSQREIARCQWPFENPHFWPRKLPM
jgi:hypothetical protein